MEPPETLDAITEPEPTEETSRLKHSGIYAGFPAILFSLTVGRDGDFYFGQVSRKFLESTGLTEDQVVGRPAREVIPAPSRDMVLAKYAEAIRSGKTVSWEEISTFPTGTKYGEVSVAPVFDAGGVCTHLVGIVYDATERRLAEEAFRESERKYKLLVETTGTGYVIVDAEGRVMDANQEFVRLSGHERLDQILGRSVLEWTAKYDQERGAAELKKCIEEGAVRHLLIDQVDAQGRIIPIEVDASVLRTPTSVVILGLCREISARRRMEQALKASEARLAHLVHSSPVVIYTCEPVPPYATTFISENVKALFGYEGDDLIRDPRSWLGKIHPEDTPDLSLNLKGLFERGMLDLEYRVRNSEGAYRWVHDEMKLVRDAGGNPLEIIGYRADISQRKRADASLRAVQQRKDEFLAVLSHELRNPLTPIRYSVHLLERCGSMDERSRRAVSIIDRQVTQLARLVDDLLDVTRISRGKIRLQRSRIDLVDLVRRTVEDHRFVLEDREVAVNLPKAALWVDGDPTRLAQIVGNLLQNAAKFTTKGGAITVSLSRTDGGALLEIADTGIGIDAEMLGRIFEPFSQADRSLDRTRGGLGLGLSLVRGLVEQHGGEVHAHSEGAGRGARFSIDLPLSEGGVDKPGAALFHGSDGRGRKVLVIEDNSDAADTLREILELAGHRVAVAYSGGEGLAKAHEFHPEIILCDLGLPGMDGYEVARALRRDAAMGSTYLVALTGYAQPEDRRRALGAGYDVHLSKPADPSVLEKLLAEAPVAAPRV